MKAIPGRPRFAQQIGKEGAQACDAVAGDRILPAPSGAQVDEASPHLARSGPARAAPEHDLRGATPASRLVGEYGLALLERLY